MNNLFPWQWIFLKSSNWNSLFHSSKVRNTRFFKKATSYILSILSWPSSTWPKLMNSKKCETNEINKLVNRNRRCFPSFSVSISIHFLVSYNTNCFGRRDVAVRYAISTGSPNLFIVEESKQRFTFILPLSSTWYFLFLKPECRTDSQYGATLANGFRPFGIIIQLPAIGQTAKACSIDVSILHSWLDLICMFMLAMFQSFKFYWQSNRIFRTFYESITIKAPK